MRLIAFAASLAALLSTPGCASAPPAAGGSAGQYLAARLAARFNDLGSAARAFERAHKNAPAETAILKDAFFYKIAAGDLDAASGLAARILADAPDEDDGLARLMLAAAEMRRGDLQAARRWARGDVSSPFMRSIAHLVDVSIERQTAGPAAALDLLKTPQPQVFIGLGTLHAAFLTEATGDLVTARASHQEALKSGDFLAIRAYGAFLERSDERAARDYYAFLAQQPGAGRKIAESGLARLGRGAASKEFTALSARQGAGAAFHLFAQAMLQQAEDERARAGLAGFNVGSPRYNFPLVLARIAIWLDPDLDEAKYLAGHILLSYRDPAAGAAALLSISPKSPLFAPSRVSVAAALSADERGREAISLVNEALLGDPDSRELRFALAGLYDQAGEHARAAALYDRLIARLPEPPGAGDWRYFLARGASLLEIGDWPRAESDLKRAVELAPEEATALNYLGYSWAERGENLDEAFRLIDRAVELEPQSGAIVDSLGWAQFQLGRYKEAVVNLERAAAMEPSDPTITDHLGDVYWKLGRKAEARFQWRRALELGPKAAQKAAISDKLANGLGPSAGEAADEAADGGA